MNGHEHFAAVQLLTIIAAIARPQILALHGRELPGAKSWLIVLSRNLKSINTGPQMQPSRRRFANPRRGCRLMVLAAVMGFGCPLAFGQAVLDKTTFGKSQNDARDLQNSLIVPQRAHLGKEKKEEVDPRTLPSKTVKDTTFQGSLLNIGLPAEDTKLQVETKPAADDKKGSKSADVGDEKGSTTSKQADASGNGQNKEHKATAAVADEKSSENATAKASATKPDGDH